MVHTMIIYNHKDSQSLCLYLVEHITDDDDDDAFFNNLTSDEIDYQMTMCMMTVGNNSRKRLFMRKMI